MIDITSLPEIETLSNHGFAEKRKNRVTGQHSLHSLQAFIKGEVISKFLGGQVFDEPNYLTVQTGIKRHITLVPEFLQYINHSCDPNVFFDTSSMDIIALKDIQANEEFTFFYPSTEWEMAQPFFCYCGSAGCLQNIKGAKYLLPNEIKKYRLTEFIRQQIL